MAKTHDCPGCGASGVPYSMFACKPCWSALPKEYRDAIYSTYRAGAGSIEHLRAMNNARRWYRNLTPTDSESNR